MIRTDKTRQGLPLVAFGKVTHLTRRGLDFLLHDDHHVEVVFPDIIGALLQSRHGVIITQFHEVKNMMASPGKQIDPA